jgi:acetyl esterase/lipase
VFTASFDTLRDASKLQEAGVDVAWHHFPGLTHGFLQMAPWSKDCEAAVTVVAKELKTLAYGGV